MASRYQKTIVFLIVMLVTTLDRGTHASVEGLQMTDNINLSPKPTGTIKTIEVPEDGDVIDCVDIYKQSTLNNPLIKDKNIQMKPSSNLVHAFNRTNKPLQKLIQNWHKYGKCPKGTVPIRRTRHYNHTIHHRSPNDDISTHEHVLAEVSPSIYYGASAVFNVWNPRVIGRYELSLSQMWIVSGTNSPNRSDLNTIEAGWMVNPIRYGDSKTRFFTFWTRDNYQRTRCYDNDCNGFMQTNRKYSIGDVVHPYSVYGKPDKQFEIIIAINRDRITGHWWLTFQDTELGYFHRDIFTSLNYGAVQLAFGGEIVNQKEMGRHTETQMGSGHFSYEGFGKASYIRKIEAVDRYYKLIDAQIITNVQISNPRCYDFKLGPPETPMKTHFYFGGPGYSPLCE